MSSAGFTPDGEVYILGSGQYGKCIDVNMGIWGDVNMGICQHWKVVNSGKKNLHWHKKWSYEYL